jgi:surface protein
MAVVATGGGAVGRSPIIMTNKSIRAAVRAFCEEGGGRAEADFMHSPKAMALYGPLANWDVSQVTDMRSLFEDAAAFNQPLNNWDVSQVTNMRWMFFGAEAFDQPLANWKVDQVTNMHGMFAGATAFNQPLADWTVDQVTDMCFMFSYATRFNQPLADWDVSHVTDMGFMFRYATAFDQPLENWEMGQVTDIGWMFFGAAHFNQPLADWKIGQVTEICGLFSHATRFNQPLADWDVSHITDMSYMFRCAAHFNQPLENWEMGQVTNKEDMFKGATVYCLRRIQPAADEGERQSKRIKQSAADNEQPSTGEVIQTVGEGPGPTPALTGESVCITSPVGGCVVAAVAVLLGLPDENVRHLLQTKLREMNQHGSADIGNAESDLYHVTVAMEVLKAQGKQVERVRPKELHRMFQKGAKALLLGRLNFNFQPYKQRTTNSKVRSPSQFLQALPNHTARVPVYCWCSADRVADPRLQEG